MSKFHVKTAGLGIFTGTKPVLYIPVVRSPQLTELHREFWPEICKTASGVLSYYAPNMWMPHITIAQGDINHDRLPHVIQLLSERDFAWDITVDNLAVIHDSGVEQTVKFRFDFG
jgi:2'-5' RNA ligase